METDFFSNFTCCGETLASLHDLVKHYEESHIRFEEDVVCRTEGLFEEEAELRSFSVSPTLPDRYHPYGQHTHHSKRHASPFSSGLLPSSTMVPAEAGSSSRKRKHHLSIDVEPYDGAGQESSAFDNTVLRRTSDQRHRMMSSTASMSAKKVQMIRNFLGLYNENSLNEAFDEEEHNNRIYSILSAASANSYTPHSSHEYDTVTFPTEDSPESEVESEEKEKVKKPYACNVPGCEKSYKNPNGLKYHMIHGHCKYTPPPSCHS